MVLSEICSLKASIAFLPDSLQVPFQLKRCLDCVVVLSLIIEMSVCIANNVDSDQTARLRRLIWVDTV